MEVFLEHIGDSENGATFRVAFHSAAGRCLLPYPDVTGLKFMTASGNKAAEWQTRVLVSQPLDDFVLNPNSRIAFDLHAGINCGFTTHRWTIALPAGNYSVHFVFTVDRDVEWYDFLAKRSRFAALTPIWRGTIQSNPLQFTVTDPHPDATK